MKDIIIIGAGGLGKEVAWLIENINKQIPTWNILGFLEDETKPELFGQKIYGYEVLGSEKWLSNYKKEIYVTCAIGKGSIRKRVYEKVLKFSNAKLAIIVDPSVRVDKTVTIGQGSIICMNCSITVDTNIGMGVLLNIGALIGHDSQIGNYCTFLPNSIAAGDTIFGDYCEIGSGAFILQGKRIVDNTIVAPLSAVYKDIVVSGMYSGNPARQLR